MALPVVVLCLLPLATATCLVSLPVYCKFPTLSATQACTADALTLVTFPSVSVMTYVLHTALRASHCSRGLHGHSMASMPDKALRSEIM
jgi:hypothetical protein